MTTSYDIDVVAWSNEQAQRIRAGKFDQLDLEHLAEEIEDVGKSEQRQLANRMSVLFAHLLKWAFQPELRASSDSWRLTIKEQRKRIVARLAKTPSLNKSLTDVDWLDDAWVDAVALARKETGIVIFPEVCPWSMGDVLAEGWLPTGS